LANQNQVVKLCLSKIRLSVSPLGIYSLISAQTGLGGLKQFLFERRTDHRALI